MIFGAKDKSEYLVTLEKKPGRNNIISVHLNVQL